MRARSPKRVTRLFGDLKVRLKLMVLHNVFFLVLAIGVYFALYPYLPDHAKTTLFIVLGVIYILAVLVLETTIMPLYVYRPLQLMLDADQATQHGDRDRELINEAFIPADEIGHIMRSRNATIIELRKREEDLEEALRKLEAQDRLVSLGLLSASVAHELNTPLTVLQGSIEKLTETSRRRRYAGTPGPHAARHAAHPPHQREPGGFLARPQTAHGAGAAAPFDRRSLDAGGHRQ